MLLQKLTVYIYTIIIPYNGNIKLTNFISSINLFNNVYTITKEYTSILPINNFTQV